MKLKTMKRLVLALAAALAIPSCATSGFDEADTDDSGAVSKAEFKRYLLETVYDEADANDDSKLTFAEWKARHPKADERKFKEPDTNRDGVITPEEAESHFRRKGTIDDLFQQIDTDRNGSVTEKEIDFFMEKMESKRVA